MVGAYGSHQSRIRAKGLVEVSNNNDSLIIVYQISNGHFEIINTLLSWGRVGDAGDAKQAILLRIDSRGTGVMEGCVNYVVEAEYSAAVTVGPRKGGVDPSSQIVTMYF
jgi:hypothetical protein